LKFSADVLAQTAFIPGALFQNQVSNRFGDGILALTRTLQKQKPFEKHVLTKFRQWWRNVYRAQWHDVHIFASNCIIYFL